MTRPKILAYYFPSWHLDPRNAKWFGEGWNEWQLLRDARPRFEGHRQPRVPAHGEIDESDPLVFDEQIDLAAAHGVDGFLFDFYWYDDGPYLNAALDKGYLQAPHRNDLEFALMWANHNLTNIFPSAAPDVDKPLLKEGPLDRAAFERMAEHIIENYFSQPSYIRIDGRPLFSIYEIGSLIEGLGGAHAAREALDWFDERARAAGHAGIHFDAVMWGFEFLPGGITVNAPERVVDDLGFSSASSYVWIHHLDPAVHSFPTSDWKGVEDAAFTAYEEYANTLSVDFSPNVTVGWDASPRTAQDTEFKEGPYPWLPVWDPSPAEFERGLRRAADFLDRHPRQRPVISINAWNEWTEGSYLLPDTVNGTEYLKAIHTVFGTAKGHRD